MSRIRFSERVKGKDDAAKLRSIIDINLEDAQIIKDFETEEHQLLVKKEKGL